MSKVKNSDYKKKMSEIRICSDCSENLHAVKTIIITTPKKNWGSVDFLHIFGAYKLLVTFPLNSHYEIKKKVKNIPRPPQK